MKNEDGYKLYDNYIIKVDKITNYLICKMVPTIICSKKISRTPAKYYWLLDKNFVLVFFKTKILMKNSKYNTFLKIQK